MIWSSHPCSFAYYGAGNQTIYKGKTLTWDDKQLGGYALSSSLLINYGYSMKAFELIRTTTVILKTFFWKYVTSRKTTKMGSKTAPKYVTLRKTTHFCRVISGLPRT